MRADPGLGLDALKSSNIEAQFTHDQEGMGIYYLAEHLGKAPSLRGNLLPICPLWGFSGEFFCTSDF
jgi:hypothetical protein